MRLLRLFVMMSLLSVPFAANAEEAKAPVMDPAKMEEMKKMMAPGEAHKALEPFAGKWDTVSKFWMSPDTPPEESKGSGEGEMVYGGRFLKETYKGTWNGEPFEGAGYVGYDNIKQEYQMVWLDSSMTGMMTSTGQYDAAAKKFEFSGKASCPLTGEKDVPMRMERVLNPDGSFTLTGYGTKDGKEEKGMEIVYTRA